MENPEIPPAVSFIGWKNSGKTTLLVSVAAELKRRGIRVATLKHGHHDFELDQPGRDSWRHFHEGEAEAVVFVGGSRVALLVREAEEPEPAALIERFYAGRGYDLVLVDGYKHGPFPKVEVHRRAAHQGPVYDPADAESGALYLALVTDDAGLTAPFPVIALGPEGPDALHVRAIADLLEDGLRDPPAGADAP